MWTLIHILLLIILISGGLYLLLMVPPSDEPDDPDDDITSEAVFDDIDKYSEKLVLNSELCNKPSDDIRN